MAGGDPLSADRLRVERLRADRLRVDLSPADDGELLRDRSRPASAAPGGDVERVSAARLVELAVLAVRLRWRLVANRARRVGRNGRRLSVLVAACYSLGTIMGLAAVRDASDADARRRLLLQVSSMALGWVFGPILLGGVDETVDPTRLALLPLRRVERFVVQAVGAVSGIGPLSAAIGLFVGLPLAVGRSAAAAVVAAVGAPLTVLTLAGSARCVASLLAIAQRSRAGRDLAILLTAFSAGALFIGAQLAGRTGGRTSTRVLGWLAHAPWALPAQAMIAARNGRIGAAAVLLAAAVAVLATVLAAWAALSQQLLLGGERTARGRARRGARPLGRASGPLGACLARQWLYLRRSPNTRVALLFGTVFGLALPILEIVKHGRSSPDAATFGILLAMLLNIGASSNLLGFDSGSLWIEVLCDGPSRTHLVSRSVGALPNLLMPTWLGALIVGAWMHHYRTALLVALVAVPVAVIVLAEGLITTVVAAYPLPDGDNPFGNRQGTDGRGGRIAAAALSGLLAVLCAAGPVVGAAYAGRAAWWGWLSVPCGLAWAGLLALASVRWTERYVRGHEPELLERLAVRAVS